MIKFVDKRTVRFILSVMKLRDCHDVLFDEILSIPRLFAATHRVNNNENTKMHYFEF